MATILSDFAKRVRNTVNGDCAGDVVANRFYVDLATTDLVLNNVIDIGILPAGHTVTDCVLIADDLDTNGTPTITLDVGIMTGTPGDGVTVRTVGQELFTAATAAQTGAIVNLTQKTGFTIAATAADRSIGVKIAAAPATAAAGRIRLLVEMAAVHSTVVF
jgi:hypothetical protein